MHRPEIARVLARLTSALVNISVSPLRERARALSKAYLVELLSPVLTAETKHGPIKFSCVSRQSYNRSILKEASTLEWIDGFSDGEVL